MVFTVLASPAGDEGVLETGAQLPRAAQMSSFLARRLSGSHKNVCGTFRRRKVARLRPFSAGLGDKVDQDVCIFMEN